MSIGTAFAFPADKLGPRRKTKILSWVSIGVLITTAIFVYYTLGASEAMKTAWISDVLTAIPPMALLFASRFELRKPTKRFPFGYTRAISVAFLVTSAVLSLVGLTLLYDALTKLLREERPPIGTMEVFGHQLWAGWMMIAALAYSLACGALVGSLKTPVARELKDKALDAEALMNRDAWMSEGAAIIGIVLVGYGHWWGDAVAAAFISLELIHDGWINTRLVIADLMDESPSKLGSPELEDLGSHVRRAIVALPMVTSAGVRLREHGRTITGDILVVLQPTRENDVVRSVAEISRTAEAVDWRLRDLVVMPVAELEQEVPPVARF